MQALVRVSHIAAGGTFTTTEIHSHVAGALGTSTKKYRLSSLRYDLYKLRAKGLVKRMARTRRYALLPNGYRLCLVYLELFHKFYPPLTAAFPRPFVPDVRLPPQNPTRLDRLYGAVTEAIENLPDAVGLKAAYCFLLTPREPYMKPTYRCRKTRLESKPAQPTPPHRHTDEQSAP